MAKPKARPLVARSLADLDEEVGVTEAAEIAHVSHNTVRNAIKSGALPARLPLASSDPRRLGRGGYRITLRALQEWMFGKGASPEGAKRA